MVKTRDTGRFGRSLIRATRGLQSWGIQRLKPLKKKITRRLRGLIRAIPFFVRFINGNVIGISEAPAISKWGLVIANYRAEIEPDLPLLPTRLALWEKAQLIQKSSGAWPISFSFPRQAQGVPDSFAGYLCPTFPGHSYSFANEADYYRNYRDYRFALTHKKGGWDCFRHLEIIHAGSVPYMPDAHLIPDNTMVFYPKVFLAEIAESMGRARVSVPPSVRQSLNTFFNQNLTTEAMARYLLRASEIDINANVLFVDTAVATRPDYQSNLTLIGLKQILGKKLSVAFPANYIYDDWPDSPTELYGRGFGYALCLDRTLKNQNEIDDRYLPTDASSLNQFDAVIVGSVTRNRAIAHELLSSFAPERTVWLHGEDVGPSRRETDSLLATGVKLFVRELN